jgi:hypothetical protein
MIKPNNICLHAYFEDAQGNQTYTDGLDYPITGWSVYDFYEGPNGGPPPLADYDLAIDDEADFPTYEEALAEASRRADLFGVAVQEY